MDKIVIKDLIIFARHGLYPEEKKLGQKFTLDLELYLNSQKAGLTGDLDESVNYGQLAQEIQELFTQTSIDLIETVAEKIARYILKSYNIVSKVLVRIKKPWAPVGLPLDTIYIEVERKRHRAFVGLGSNMGDRESNLEEAISLIEDDYTKIKTVSSFINTKAWGKEDQDDFLNAVVELETFYQPENLLTHLQKIENDMGRVRKEAWGPRNIDLDILFIDDLVIRSSNLSLPHPYLSERAFVLEPLAEIAPKFVDPISHKTIEQLLRDLK